MPVSEFLEAGADKCPQKKAVCPAAGRRESGEISYGVKFKREP